MCRSVAPDRLRRPGDRRRCALPRGAQHVPRGHDAAGDAELHAGLDHADERGDGGPRGGGRLGPGALSAGVVRQTESDVDFNVVALSTALLNPKGTGHDQCVRDQPLGVRLLRVPQEPVVRERRRLPGLLPPAGWHFNAIFLA